MVRADFIWRLVTVGAGLARVVELLNPTAHAEVIALRRQEQRLGTVSVRDGVMCASSELRPMCLVAC